MRKDWNEKMVIKLLTENPDCGIKIELKESTALFRLSFKDKEDKETIISGAYPFSLFMRLIEGRIK